MNKIISEKLTNAITSMQIISILTAFKSYKIYSSKSDRVSKTAEHNFLQIHKVFLNRRCNAILHILFHNNMQHEDLKDVYIKAIKYFLAEKEKIM